MKKYCCLLATVSFIFLASCKKSFLDVPVTNETIAEKYVVDLATSESFLNGIFFVAAKDVYKSNNITYADVAADNAKALGTGLAPHYNWRQEAGEGDGYSTNMNTMWASCYAVIRSCNFLIENVDRFRNENPAKADFIKGQAYSLRGLMHFNLVTVFAQPYIYTAGATHPGIPYDTVFNQSQRITRQTVKEVYDHIVIDLTRGLALTPASLITQSQINRNAAKSLLARAYLFMSEYGNARDLSSGVCSNVLLMPPADYPAKLFTANDKETLFWMMPSKTSAGQTTFQGYDFSRTDRFAATLDIVNSIKERPADLRNSWFANTSNIWQVRKFPKNAATGNFSFPEWAYYMPVVRVSEMYLTAAEGFAKTGNEDSARRYLDAIRKRADASAPASSASGTALLDSIYKERRKELCYENMRMFDLLRLGQPVSRTDVLTSAPQNLPYPSNKAIAPIPLLDVRFYPLEQNPGY